MAPDFLTKELLCMGNYVLKLLINQNMFQYRIFLHANSRINYLSLPAKKMTFQSSFSPLDVIISIRIFDTALTDGPSLTNQNCELFALFIRV